MTDKAGTKLVLRTIAHPHLSTTLTLKVMGSIVSKHVLFLEIQFRSLMQRARSVLLDLSGVREVDARGIEMLKRIAGENLRLINCSSAVKEHLESDECSLSGLQAIG